VIVFRRSTAAGTGLRAPEFGRRLQVTAPAAASPDAREAGQAASDPASPQPQDSGLRPNLRPKFLARSHQASPERQATPADEKDVDRRDAVLGSPGRSRSIAIAARVMTIVGDTAAGVLLSQLIYWTRRGVDVAERDGWIFKTAHDWEQETGMSWKVQRRARSILLAMGVIEERKQQMPARLEFRLKLSALVPLLAQRADVVMASGMDLVQFRDATSDVTDTLIGRAFLFHGSLARLFPVHSAMMCSRLLAPARLPSLEPQALMQAAARSPGGQTRLTLLQRDEWQAETGLTRDQWQTARRNLRDAGVLVERRHNFPRRVDLAVDMRALADLLRHSAARSVQRHLNLEIDGQEAVSDDRSVQTRPYRLDRAKQAGGFGQCPIPPSQSPNPADTDSPIQPIAIAQSHLYPLGLQGSLHPPRQEARARTALDSPILPSLATVWGGGGVYGAIKVEYRPMALPRSQATATATPVTNPPRSLHNLVWPRLFAEADQGNAIRHLAGLDQAIQQSVLDEIDWMRQAGKEIRSPVALVRTLARRAKAGDFVPDGAHRVAAGRTAAEAEAKRLREEAEARQRPPAPREPLSPETEAVRQKLKNLSAQMKRRVA
jgi:hypothetical protein